MTPILLPTPHPVTPADPAGEPAATSLLDRLIEAGLLFPTGVDGLYGRSHTYQCLLDGVAALVHGWALRSGATTVHLPPVMARSVFDATDYLRSFPNLAGSVHVFGGGDREHAELLRALAGGDWPALFEPAEVVLAPAACHGLYPMCTGTLPEGGRRFEVSATCFRHEPSRDPLRMQSFDMHEIVYVGGAADAERHRDQGMEVGLGLLGELGLEVAPAPANDPFFGRLGASLAAGQRDEGLKFEGVAELEAGRPPVALMSANYHRDHFGAPFRIETADGGTAHSACVGFGADRVAVALLATNGMAPSRWGLALRRRLSL